MILLLLNNYHSSVKNSDYIKITKGNPQGSKISPTLFIIYINEILNEIND